MSNVPVGCELLCQRCQRTTTSANAATEPKSTPTAEYFGQDPSRFQIPAVETAVDTETETETEYFCAGEIVKCWECQKLCAVPDDAQNVTHLVCLNTECSTTFSPNECDREDEAHGQGRGRTNLEAWARAGLLHADSSDDELDYSLGSSDDELEAQEHQNQPASSASSMYPNVSWSGSSWMYRIYNSNWTPQRRIGSGFATDLLAYQAYVAVCVKEGTTPKKVKRAVPRARTGDTPWERDISGAC